MKKLLLSFLIMIPLILIGQSNSESKRILMVVSSYGKDSGQSRPGYEFDEFTQAYLVFKSNNLDVVVASPKGGEVEADKFNKDKAYNKTVLEDAKIMELLKNTISTSSINPADFDALYVVGGKGAMFDLPFDPSLQDIIINLYLREGTVISSVCHGPASFVNIKNGDDFIIKDIEITSFSNTEEDLFGKKWVQEFPFKLEDKLKSRGAIFSQADFMLSNVVVSGKFVTGQNPFSTTRSAEEVVKALGFEPVERTLYSDEKSIYLIQDILNNKINIAAATKELKKNESAYDIDLIAVYGFYKMLAAQDNSNELSKGVGIVELTRPYFFNENLQFALAKSHISLGNNQRAREILEELNSKGLLNDKVSELMEQIN